jgi:glycine/sarcosine/betaine reductase complex component C subunit beta
MAATAQRAAVLGATLVLEHVPDLVRFGSKPQRERERRADLEAAFRSYEDVCCYPPHQVFIGALRPEELWELERPWWRSSNGALSEGPWGEIMPQRAFLELLTEIDQFDLVQPGEEADEQAGELPLRDGGESFGRFVAAHGEDEALSALVLLENLACKASGVHALRLLLARDGVHPEAIEYVIGCGEEAVGDRYQRGGGALGKAIAEAAGLGNAAGSDVKAFCAGPIHALVLASALIEAGVYERVAVVAGGSLAKLGMKFLGALKHGVPVLEDVLAGMAVLLGRADGEAPVVRTDAVGRHRVGSGSSQEELLTDLVVVPLERLGRQIADVDRFATELHDPEITEPAAGGDVPERNYRMIAALAVLRGELSREAIPTFSREHGLPGFSPTQGHIASAVPWLPHALTRLQSGELMSTMLVAKGSLFLGRMTQLWDGASILLEAPDGG